MFFVGQVILALTLQATLRVIKKRNVKYLSKSYYWEKLTFSRLRFSKFKKFVSRSNFGELQLTQISLNFKLLVSTYESEVWKQNCVWLFYYFNFERNYDDIKSKSPCILLNKKINFNKNETESNTENPTHIIERRNLCFSSYKNRKLKVKPWWEKKSSRKKKEGIFCTVYFVRRNTF